MTDLGHGSNECLKTISKVNRLPVAYRRAKLAGLFFRQRCQASLYSPKNAPLCYVSRATSAAAAHKPTDGSENSSAVHLFQIYMQLDKSKTNSFQAGISHSYGSPLVWNPAPELLTQQRFSCFFSFLFFFFQLKNFFPTESLNALPTRLEEFCAQCLGNE